MKNVLFVHSSSELYGSDRSLLNIVKNLDKNEFNIFVLLPCQGPLVEEMRKLENITVEIYEVAVLRRKNLSIRGGVEYLKKLIQSTAFIKKYIKRNNIDIVDINNTDSSETDQIYSAQSGENISGEMREDERYRFYFQDKLEIPILEKNFPHDREILMEILELLVETVTSRKKFLRICGEEKPKEVVKSRLMKLDSMHIQYVMECLKSNTTQVRNIKQYLLATLYNAPTTIDSYYAAQVRHDFGWGGRSN